MNTESSDFPGKPGLTYVAPNTDSDQLADDGHHFPDKALQNIVVSASRDHIGIGLVAHHHTGLGDGTPIIVKTLLQ